MALSEKERLLARLFTACVLGEWAEVARLRTGAEPDRAWRETVLQVHVFAGFPRLVEAYGVLAEAGGLGTPEPDELGVAPDADARGRALFERIYGSGAARVEEMLREHHPLYADWILTHAYGRVLARDGLSARGRELLAVAALAALGQDRQLASHARGAVRCGADPAELTELLGALEGLVASERLARARDLCERFGRSDERA